MLIRRRQGDESKRVRDTDKKNLLTLSHSHFQSLFLTLYFSLSLQVAAYFAPLPAGEELVLPARPLQFRPAPARHYPSLSIKLWGPDGGKD